MKIGLTGGIATGKSTVSSMLAKKGALLVDADAIAREVMLPGHPVLAEVTAHFGQDVLLEDGTLNRKKLGEIIFHQPDQRQVLNEITHPAIRREIEERMARYEAQHPQRLVVADIPLLLESRAQYPYLEQIVVVYVPREVQIGRLMERDALTRDAAEARVASQMDIEEKKQMADCVIDNSGTLTNTQLQVDKLWLQMVQL
ncbi:dephospho-CoA kinase [Paenibacillus sp. JCM 10914]|uniref:dephospho-CoA kinase n=1 Tax=Paenibacillus sp. JCM 10914 TaxID=1236974 RepID=UPI0003CC6C14|nr:dephospho-CoA kinase [Paenibacillus sp. JCM 10914]GAE06964.1 dephospho-CoA kinase [Paenibacillus sp. JCM 10914]